MKQRVITGGRGTLGTCLRRRFALNGDGMWVSRAFCSGENEGDDGQADGRPSNPPTRARGDNSVISQTVVFER